MCSSDLTAQRRHCIVRSQSHHRSQHGNADREQFRHPRTIQRNHYRHVRHSDNHHPHGIGSLSTGLHAFSVKREHRSRHFQHRLRLHVPAIWICRERHSFSIRTAKRRDRFIYSEPHNRQLHCDTDGEQHCQPGSIQHNHHRHIRRAYGYHYPCCRSL